MAKSKPHPQLPLRLDAEAPDSAARWRDGASLLYLGDIVTLRLGTPCKEALLRQGELHLPLPPEATPRQVQDAAESWLRARALRVIAAQAVMEARRLGRPAPSLSLSFAGRGGWMQVEAKGDAGHLRAHWRLVEQPPEVVAQVVAHAVARLPRVVETFDLFALA
jgi:predicted metal-dependent hydrolase